VTGGSEKGTEMAGTRGRRRLAVRQAGPSGRCSTSAPRARPACMTTCSADASS